MTDPISNERLAEMQKDCGIPHPPTQETYWYRLAVSGVGPHAYDWSDKPHRLIFDLCRIIEEAQASRRQSPAGVDPFGYWCECKGAEPAFLRKPAYIPPTDDLHTTTPLYASPPPKADTVTDEMVERVFNAAWDCSHSIDGSAVTLRVDPAKPGNALSQLRQRIAAALTSEAHNGQ